MPDETEGITTASITEDRDEILQLLYRYNHMVDSGDAEGWASTFTDDGIFDVGGRVMTGRDALVAFAGNVGGGGRHVVANPLIDISQDTATVRAYVFVFRNGTASTTGSYADDLVRTVKGWRFSRRVFTPVAPGG